MANLNDLSLYQVKDLMSRADNGQLEPLTLTDIKKALRDAGFTWSILDYIEHEIQAEKLYNAKAEVLLLDKEIEASELQLRNNELEVKISDLRLYFIESLLSIARGVMSEKAPSELLEAINKVVDNIPK